MEDMQSFVDCVRPGTLHSRPCRNAAEERLLPTTSSRGRKLKLGVGLCFDMNLGRECNGVATVFAYNGVSLVSCDEDIPTVSRSRACLSHETRMSGCITVQYVVNMRFILRCNCDGHQGSIKFFLMAA